MEPAEHPGASSDPPHSTSPHDEPPVWTYPTRFCRICREDVPATVTMYPPGLPLQFQKPIVEYKNEDEYGRLIKPCKCRGSLRYIHELCLLRSRTENNRSGSMWKCHECGHNFDFKRLTLQSYLSSRVTIGVFTVIFMVFIVFLLGFIADPIINIYMDPYESLIGRESIWDELEVRSSRNSHISAWSQHFAKGVISMGVVGFLKTLFLNPFQWINVRFNGGWVGTSGTRRGVTGRDRAANISWIAVLIGICTAFVFFYRWMEAFVQRSLQRIGNNIVDTQLPGDDDDLKPPPGWKPTVASETQSTSEQTSAETPAASKSTNSSPTGESQIHTDQSHRTDNLPSQETTMSEERERPSALAAEQMRPNPPPRTSTPIMSGSWIEVEKSNEDEDDDSSALRGVHRQGWSFSNL